MIVTKTSVRISKTMISGGEAALAILERLNAPWPACRPSHHHAARARFLSLTRPSFCGVPACCRYQEASFCLFSSVLSLVLLVLVFVITRLLLVSDGFWLFYFRFDMKVNKKPRAVSGSSTFNDAFLITAHCSSLLLTGWCVCVCVFRIILHKVTWNIWILEAGSVSSLADAPTFLWCYAASCTVFTSVFIMLFFFSVSSTPVLLLPGLFFQKNRIKV